MCSPSSLCCGAEPKYPTSPGLRTHRLGVAWLPETPSTQRQPTRIINPEPESAITW